MNILHKNKYKKHKLYYVFLLFTCFFTISPVFSVSLNGNKTISNLVNSTNNNTEVILQQISVTGKIVDSYGDPLPGVTVMIKGTSSGTITDIDGNFSLPNVSTSSILVFSFVGMNTQEIVVGNQTNINLTMTEESIGLQEVVAIGYGTEKKVNVIGSLTTVSSEEIKASPVGNVSQALQGRLPGAFVRQYSGEPGENDAEILIRGRATLGNASPLVVVDGIPGRDLNTLASGDIESITVLKDASAAIYGAQAANGVILVTTKSGAENTPLQLNYEYFYGMESPTLLPEMADAYTYSSMVRELQSYKNVAESNMMFSLEDIEKYKSGEYPWTHPNTNWYREALKDFSSTHNHFISVNGGTQNVNYYGSFGSHSEDAIYVAELSKYNRYNVKARVDSKVNDYLRVGIDLQGSLENSIFPSRGRSNVFNNTKRSLPTTAAFWPNGLPGPDIERGDNPVVISGPEAGFDKNSNSELNSTFTATLNVPFISGLSLSTYYSYQKHYGDRKYLMKPFYLYALDKDAYYNAGNTGKEDGSKFLIANKRGEVNEPQVTDYYDDSYRTIFNAMANYNKTINNVHYVSAFIAMESSDYFAKGIEAFRRYFISDQLPYLFAGGTKEWSNNGHVNLDARVNYFGRLMYNFRETYLFQFSLRRDGSLRFSEDVGRWGTFPSFLFGWRISNEDYWNQNIKLIDYLKLKFSYGQMGNDHVDPFQYLTSYGFNTGMVFGARSYNQSLAQIGTPNPNITWEVANVYNAGFESTLLNSKMFFNADFFYQRRSNILIKRNASVPLYTGITLPDENFGIVDSKGFEIDLGYGDRNGDFSYNVGANAAFSRNKIVEFDEPERSVPWQVRTGQPQGVFLLYKSIGIFKDEAHVNSLPHVPGAKPGDIIIEDYDGDGEITSDDRIFFKNTQTPELTYGVNFNLGYKNWNLSGLITGSSTTMMSRYVNLTGTSGNYFAYEGRDRWTPDNTDATKPRAYEREEAYWRSQYPTDYNYDYGGYARLKNLRLSYRIPSNLLNAIKVKGAELYLSGNNLFLIYSENEVVDPELNDVMQYPIMKTYAVGIKITL